jgi:molybdopterin-containing oxidoreductase family iron-sulfur binding subunit
MSPLNELPLKRSEYFAGGPAVLNRRQALRLLATGISSGLAACNKPVEEIIPYIKMPERVLPGEALKFATTLSLSGFGRGVIVISIDGRPIKVEGNPRHPASLGATDVFAEAAILSLYDPDRSRAILNKGAIASPDAFKLALQVQLQQMRQSDGEGFRLITGRVTSPTLLRQIDELLQIFPKAAWHAYEPIDDDNARAGTALAFGRPLQVLSRLDKARSMPIRSAKARISSATPAASRHAANRSAEIFRASIASRPRRL